MRQLKFRAWDTATKTMLITGFHFFGETTCFDLICQMVMENNPNKIECSLMRMNDVVVMQFTGLLDKNKKQIYEGDILRYVEKMCDLGDAQTLIAKVIYDQDVAAFGLGLNDERGCWNYFTDRTISHFEVIGNEFENPKLLK